MLKNFNQRVSAGLNQSSNAMETLTNKCNLATVCCSRKLHKSSTEPSRVISCPTQPNTNSRRMSCKFLKLLRNWWESTASAVLKILEEIRIVNSEMLREWKYMHNKFLQVWVA